MNNLWRNKEIFILGLKVTFLSREDVAIKLYGKLLSNDRLMVVTANPVILLMARRNKQYKNLLNNADLVTADGIGVCWAATFLEEAKNLRSRFKIIYVYLNTIRELLFCSGENKIKIFPPRISGADLVWDLAKIAEKENKKIYLVGGKNQTAFRAAQKLKNIFPKLIISAYQPDHVATKEVSPKLHDELETFRPDIVIVAYGAPRQEEWIEYNLSRYDFIKIAIGVGGALDFIVGNTSRASLRLRNYGLEWFWRLLNQPWRFVRVLRSTVQFPIMILISRLKNTYDKQ